MPEILIGRQPIFDCRKQVYAYELLVQNDESFSEDEAISPQLVNEVFLEIGLDRMVGRHRALFPYPPALLLNGLPPWFPNQRVAIEVPFKRCGEPDFMQALTSYSEQGYNIVLNDFEFDSRKAQALVLAHVAKLNVAHLGMDGVVQQLALLKPYPVRVLAEQIESYAQLSELSSLAIDYFQGVFLSKPDILRERSLLPNRVNTLRLLSRLNDTEVETTELETIICADVALSYKLLRYLNSAVFHLPREVKSIREAVVLLGQTQVKRWASLVVMTRVEDKPSELISLALIRAKMCEMLAEAQGEEDTGPYFTAGLFSTLDALLDCRMADLLEGLPLVDELKRTLLHRKGRYGQILQFVIDYEHMQADRNLVPGLDADTIRGAYFRSLDWSIRARVGL